MSLLVPGLGHVYSGQARKGTLLFGLLLVVDLSSIAVMLWVPYQWLNLILPLLLLLGIRFYIAADAASAAMYRGSTYTIRVYNKWYVYAAISVLVLFAFTPAWAATLRTVLIQAFRIPSGGMEDTILRGDHILVDKSAYGLQLSEGDSRFFRLATPRRGDIVVFHYPERRSRTLVKRVVGLPGEKAEIRDGEVYVNGQALAEPYARFAAADADRDWGPIVVPEGHFFVLGDNRDSTRDSRHWGLLPLEDVFGRAACVYWSRDPLSGDARWDRVGKILR